MAKRDEFELKIVESMIPLPAMPLARRLPPMPRRSGPTRAEALVALRATKGAASVIERLPNLEQTGAWGEAAYWTPCETRGAAQGVFLWDCDFPDGAWSMFDAYVNCIAYFAGAEDLGGLIPPKHLSGQVWCYFDTPVGGTYLFLAQVQTYPDQYYGPDYVAIINCLIDNVFLGTRLILPGNASLFPFVVNLSPGNHRFDIQQGAGGVFFESLSAWTIPVATQ